MSFLYSFFNGIKLNGANHVPEADALRQEKTAIEILSRLQNQPGLILADEVGMGKTFVALAVASSVALGDAEKRPVVIMVPPSLKNKWPRDFELFKSRCLNAQDSKHLTAALAEKPVEFLKLLDDPEERRVSIIFLTHGAMGRHLDDVWVKLAVIQRALYRRKDVDLLRRKLCDVMGRLLRASHINDAELWEKLLLRDPSDWLKILKKNGIAMDREDDPVPQTLVDALEFEKSDQVFEALNKIPFRQTIYFEDHLKNAREEIAASIKEIWKLSLAKVKLKMPLLILDEAHHLKNAQTQVASLFQSPDSEADANEMTRGALAGAFERMLFLTATPFQLGHNELCSVLERFHGISWESGLNRNEFSEKVNSLREYLDSAQDSANRLDRTWGTLRQEDLCVGDTKFETVDAWWEAVQKSGADKSTLTTQRVFDHYRETFAKMKAAEVVLKPWVIRHLKAQMLPEKFGKDEPRRLRLVGAAIDPNSAANSAAGIQVKGPSMLPFLLAARAVACSPESRPVFSEGLASSYEAFLHTRRQREASVNAAANPLVASITDRDDSPTGMIDTGGAVKWYLDNIEQALPLEDTANSATHPKIALTVKRVMERWIAGEKVLVFCHYVATGRALRNCISAAMISEINTIAAQKLKCSEADANNELDRLGEQLSGAKSKKRKVFDSFISEQIRGFDGFTDEKGDLQKIVRKMLGTPSFLVRYFPLEGRKLGEAASVEELEKAFLISDDSGETFRGVLEHFFTFLTTKCEPDTRRAYISALVSTQTSSHKGQDALSLVSDDEKQNAKAELLLGNVKLANGDLRNESRQRLMLTFNTPFFPEVLIASSIMAEGVDLHLNCRHVIHHDLCWNPSTLEQRTGRVDRLGAKAEKCGKPINIYLPYVAETQDEKMYRVVMDRERWFQIVMGDKFKVDSRTTEILAERIALPESVAVALSFKLQIWDN